MDGSTITFQEGIWEFIHAEIGIMAESTGGGDTQLYPLSLRDWTYANPDFSVFEDYESLVISCLGNHLRIKKKLY